MIEQRQLKYKDYIIELEIFTDYIEYSAYYNRLIEGNEFCVGKVYYNGVWNYLFGVDDYMHTTNMLYDLVEITEYIEPICKDIIIQLETDEDARRYMMED